MKELVQTWEVHVLDLSWGRNGHIWQTLCAAAGYYSEEPYDDLLAFPRLHEQDNCCQNQSRPKQRITVGQEHGD